MAFSPRGFHLGNRSPGNSISNSPSPSFSHPAHNHRHHTDEKHTNLTPSQQPPPPRHHNLDSFSSRPQCLDNHSRYSSAPLAIRKNDHSRATLDSFTNTITNSSGNGIVKGKFSNGAHIGTQTNNNNNNIMVTQHRQRQLGLVAGPHRPETPVFNKVVTSAVTPTISPTITQSATLLSSSSSTVTSVHRPMAPTSPVRIPASKNQRGEKRYHDGYKHHQRRGRKSSAQKCPGHNPDAISPSVAALLAITNIPRSRATRSQALAGRATGQSREESMTVDAIIQRVQRNEKEISLTLSRSPMDLLLSSPDGGMDDSDCLSFSDDFDDNASLVSSTPSRINISARTVSDDSVSSLDDSFTSGSVLSPVVSPGTPGTPLTNYTPSTFGSSYRRKSPRVPLRRRPEPLSSPPGCTSTYDPLASPSPTTASVDQLDFRVFDEGQQSGSEDDKNSDSSFRPLKSAFKSNLTASLRALRNAARSISNLGIASIPPEDFLTRSMLTIDPRVPFTDERRPPPLEEEPSAALRRYLNPTTTARMELRPAEPDSSAALARPNFTASIQMQTYKVRRSRSGSHHGTSPSSPRGIPRPSPQKSTAGESELQSSESAPDVTSPLALPGRQREMRENSDFIRIAVMEMAMRKRGKLNDQRPGRARWALPPRKISSKEYEVGPDGVPARWVPVLATY